MVFLVANDLAEFAEIDSGKAAAMIADAEALAILAAPCLVSEDEDDELSTVQTAAVKAILRGAIIRWHESGSGVRSSETVGPFGQTLDTSRPRRGMFWPSEITQLQDICGGGIAGGAFSIDTTPECVGGHADICAVNFGANYCSCGAILAGYPLYEVS